MAENKRVRLEPHIEEYLKSHAQRVLGKSVDLVTTADLTTITNALLYEHKLAQSMVKQIPFIRLFDWLTSLIPSNNKVLQIPQVEPAALTPKTEPENYEFDADLGDLYEEAA
ncbi:hypothetical protein [Iningainema tapete]|uniref:Uncharacterized protein n=1 Tax=Iningainema tapete BLCC-T55 TaxID=2748662 RepID=A0A8J6XHV2_9CYAN|nr:hypothetical protein [Iningainema tapete]MBD2770961.1 hypothetical protein [Iningainema tapete BLCC-T55]